MHMLRLDNLAVEFQRNMILCLKTSGIDDKFRHFLFFRYILNDLKSHSF